MSDPLKICYAASEVAPYSKTGGLADVGSALPRELKRLGHDVRVFTPLYSSIDRAAHGLRPVDFAQNFPIRQGNRESRCSLWTTPDNTAGSGIYFVDCPEMFHRDSIYTSGPDEGHRFALLSRAVIEGCQRMGFAPDLFHCNDWHTALIPLLLRTAYEWDSLFRAAKSIVTIHNIGYQGSFPAGIVGELGLGDWARKFDNDDLQAGRVSFLKTGLLHADVVSTVSPGYAREIQTDEYGMGLEGLLRARSGSLVGILNGVDYDEWSPDKDKLIPHAFSRTAPAGKRKNKQALLKRADLADGVESPTIGVVSRLTYQKGFDLCFDVLPRLIPRLDLRVVVLGEGEDKYEQFFQQLRDRFPGNVAYYRGYNNEFAHWIEAGSDMFLMPSRYEPCGLNQMFSMRYGTIPIVRKTGGLADSVQLFDSRTGEGNGFVFEHFNTDALTRAIHYAVKTYRSRPLWSRLVDNAMGRDYSWTRQAGRYVELYSWIARR